MRLIIEHGALIVGSGFLSMFYLSLPGPGFTPRNNTPNIQSKRRLSNSRGRMIGCTPVKCRPPGFTTPADHTAIDPLKQADQVPKPFASDEKIRTGPDFLRGIVPSIPGGFQCEYAACTFPVFLYYSVRRAVEGSTDRACFIRVTFVFPAFSGSGFIKTVLVAEVSAKGSIFANCNSVF